MQVHIRWLDRAREGEGPIYLRVVASLGLAIQDGELGPGDRLPPQRSAAEHLGVDLTTISRAYSRARELGLIEGAVGSGTFVRANAGEEDLTGAVDLSMNVPPPVRGAPIGKRLSVTLQEILASTDTAALMGYHVGPASPGQASLAQAWLRPCLGDVARGRLAVSAGAQSALHAVLTLLMQRGETLLVEPLVYPGVLAAARQLGLRLEPLPVDAHGVVPAGLEDFARRTGAKTAYLCPTFQNPTGVTLGEARRREIADALERTGTTLIEDDAYGRLPAHPVLAIAHHAPERTWHIATVAKTLSPGLRVAYVAAPTEAATDRLVDCLRATALMPCPLTVALVSRWIRDGQAETVLGDIRAEAVERRALAAEILPAATGGAESLHVWLDLAPGHDEARIQAAARDKGLSLVASSAFCEGPTPRPGLRLSLGGARSQASLRSALEDTRRILHGDARTRTIV